MIETPVALFIFNRPQLTEMVFNAIREAAPKKFLIVADGPRFPQEEEKCLQARSIVEKVDWPCQVLTQFSDVNLGCKQRVSSGLDWVFSQVEEAIILEDDCLPSPSFFVYCQELLEYYRNDKRVMQIGGTHIDDGIPRAYSYYFSKYAEVWGWASWRRAWRYYDVKMTSWPDFKTSGGMKSFCVSPDEENYWTGLFDQVFQGKIDTWDYQWVYTCFVQSGLTIRPSINLISNLGCHQEATHTKLSSHPLSNLKRGEMGKIIHPPFLTRQCEAEQFMFYNYFLGKKARSVLWKKIRGKIKSWVSMLKPKPAYGWFGDYPDWAAAKKECSGYDAANILEKCKAALLKVKNGEAVYERDSVLFDKIEYSWGPLAALLRSTLEHGGKLHVLDFGGSLGSSYYQNRTFLLPLQEFSWSIVEQPHFVECGKENFEDGVLKFYDTIESCLKERRADVLLLSGVIQYLEDPYAWTRKFCSFGFEYIIVDLVGLIDSKDQLTVQKVPPDIYQASYPCWLLNRRKLIDSFSEKYACLAQFDDSIGRGLSVDGKRFDYGGFVLKRARS